MSQTAVEWLVSQMKEELPFILDQSVIDQALEMEQIQMHGKKLTDFIVSDGIVTVDANNYTVKYNGQTKHLTKKLIQLLQYFIAHKGQVITREELIKNIWEDDVIVDPRTIDVHVTKLRKQLFKRCIMTMPRVGYKWN